MSEKADKTQREIRFIRDTVESIWVAIVLALVLRAFMVEAFVIPTGSMAPRLLGAHWNIECPACGYAYDYGMPRERPDRRGLDRARRHLPAGASCPQCGYRYSKGPRYIGSGDRVLVLKYLYHFTEPRPWDIIVFRNPQNNRENYIKRLIGLPGETIEIVHGDIFVADGPAAAMKIRRKPPRAQQAMWQVVYDNDYRSDLEMLRRENIVSPRWAAGRGAQRWDLRADGGRRFIFAGTAPSAAPAELFFQGGAKTFLPHYGYNPAISERNGIDEETDICSDLKLSLTLVPGEKDGCLGLMLTSFEHDFKAELSTDGVAVLYYKSHQGADGQWVERARKKIPRLRPNHGYDVALTHVDFSVTLWVDGEAVIQLAEGYPSSYQALKDRLSQLPQRRIPIPQVKIFASGGPCRLMHVKLMRDVYYTSARLDDPFASGKAQNPLYQYAREEMQQMVRQSSGRGWATTGNPIVLGKHEDTPDLDEFFVLGDNSPQSLDGRGWTSAAPSLRLYDDQGKPIYKLGTVPRYNLIGKAMFVYWPAGFRLPVLPGLSIVPNVGRMRLIR